MAESAGSLSSTVTKAIVTAAVTSIAGALIGWIGGWLPGLWTAIATAAAATWSFLVYPVPLLLAIVMLLALPFTIRFLRGVRYVIAPAASPAKPVEAPLSELQEQLLRLLASRDGKQVLFEEAVSYLFTSNLILQQQCEGLSERGYIEPANHRVWGLHIALTREGRDFVIKQGFVR